MIAAPNSSNHQAEYRCWQEERNKSERAGLQDGIETCYDAWFGDGGTDKKTGGGAGRGIAEDVMIFTESEHYWNYESEGELRLSSFETKLVIKSWDGLDIGWGIVDMSDKYLDDETVREKQMVGRPLDGGRWSSVVSPKESGWKKKKKKKKGKYDLLYILHLSYTVTK